MRRKDWYFRASRNFWHNPAFTLAEKGVVHLILSYCTREGIGWPTKPQLAKAGRISETALGKHLRSLRSKGAIYINTFRDEHGRNRNHYTVNPSIVGFLPPDHQ